jgi:hypothetical protein
MPAPHGPIYPWQKSGKTEWQCVLILGVTHGEEYILRTYFGLILKKWKRCKHYAIYLTQNTGKRRLL